MSPQPNISSVAFLIAEPARAAMLMALFDGSALPAGELAHAAGVTAQTASAHLAKLLYGGLLSCEQQGRHRYYRLSDPHVAAALEHLAAISSVDAVRRKPLNRAARDLRFARCCYDHLAGQLGVAVTQALQQRRFIAASADKQFELSAAGHAWFTVIGVDIDALKPTRNGLARQCLDWTERSHHLAGPLGVQLMSALCDAGWLRRTKSSRAIQVTPKGWAGLKAQLDIDERMLAAAATAR
ncbi:DNA-binding transcriptional ArsR family regulator [Collimonas sp. PA-H2]|uniref:ArsR/SmtB family transcription factor n=1 Tax=Collimonas sp. PA-H2 TaxID=1881062 RepID=UPI000C00F205|nr:helix-turn-helix transcriptional regulator [Collimonas sp. PA-H2]PFH11119.1 DNA-binding transcriptional ArsR family regulator [Collimonas sp. PA-H2]